MRGEKGHVNRCTCIELQLLGKTLRNIWALSILMMGEAETEPKLLDNVCHTELRAGCPLLRWVECTEFNGDNQDIKIIAYNR